jgi:hypothetical protein
MRKESDLLGRRRAQNSYIRERALGDNEKEEFLTKI